jgi:tetratricopeptide (TPR) repeat protein
MTLPPRHHKHRRGWFAPIGRFFDRISYSWWRFRQRVRRVFDFRWLTTRLTLFGHYFMSGFRYPFYIIGWLLRQAWSMIAAWWQIRNFRFLIQGLPALLGIIFISVVAVYTALRSSEGLQELYQRQALDARLSGVKQKEQLCYERLLQLHYSTDPRRLETQYGLARVSMEMGNRQRATFLLAELANPDTDQGFPLAHIESAWAIWHNPQRRAKELDLMERHLRRALSKQPDSPEANSLMGIMLANTYGPSGTLRHDEAIPFLLKSKQTDINARITLATIFKDRGDEQRAELYARPVLDYLLKLSAANIDEITYPLDLTTCYLKLNEFEKAIETAEKAYRNKKSELFRAMLSNCYVAWYRWLDKMPRNALRERQKLDVLLQSLDWDQTNVEALSYFVNFMKPGGGFANEREDAHKVLLALRGNNPYLHLWLGQKLFQENKFEEARQEWDMAYKLFPDSPIIANNFAWILTHGSPAKQNLPNSGVAPDLGRAEAIINQVIARTPKEHPFRFQFHGTRGTIYLRLGQLDKAREDLVFASQGPNAVNDQVLHQQLIELYRRLGLNNRAEAHRRILEDIYRRNNRETQGQPAETK